MTGEENKLGGGKTGNGWENRMGNNYTISYEEWVEMRARDKGERSYTTGYGREENKLGGGRGNGKKWRDRERTGEGGT